MLLTHSLLLLSFCLLFAGPVYAYDAMKSSFGERRHRLFPGRAGRLRGLELPTPRVRWVFRFHATVAVLISLSAGCLFDGMLDPTSAPTYCLRALLLFTAGGLSWMYLETVLTRAELLGRTHWLSPWIQVGPADNLEVPTDGERRFFRRHLFVAYGIILSGAVALVFAV